MNFKSIATRSSMRNMLLLTKILIGRQKQPRTVVNVIVNAKTAIVKRLAVQITNPERICETKKC